MNKSQYKKDKEHNDKAISFLIVLAVVCLAIVLATVQSLLNN